MCVTVSHLWASQPACSLHHPTQFGGIDDPQAVVEAQATVADDGFDRCLVGLQKIGLHAQRLEALEEIQTLIPFLEQRCRVLAPVKLVVDSGSQVLVLVDNFYPFPFDLKRDG